VLATAGHDDGQLALSLTSGNVLLRLPDPVQDSGLIEVRSPLSLNPSPLG
jgi:hypothetical protein